MCVTKIFKISNLHQHIIHDSKNENNIALTYWYCASWSFVGRGTLSCCTFGSHVFDRDDPDYGALDYVSALGYNVMISLIET
jgi:hypothetical protein